MGPSAIECKGLTRPRCWGSTAEDCHCAPPRQASVAHGIAVSATSPLAAACRDSRTVGQRWDQDRHADAITPTKPSMSGAKRLRELVVASLPDWPSSPDSVMER